jgi:hypothetical protein
VHTYVTRVNACKPSVKIDPVTFVLGPNGLDVFGYRRAGFDPQTVFYECICHYSMQPEAVRWALWATRIRGPLLKAGLVLHQHDVACSHLPGALMHVPNHSMLVRASGVCNERDVVMAPIQNLLSAWRYTNVEVCVCGGGGVFPGPISSF